MRAAFAAVLCGDVEEERSGVITNMLENPPPSLHSAGKLPLSNFL